jgi:hypothetical protein
MRGRRLNDRVQRSVEESFKKKKYKVEEDK